MRCSKTLLAVLSVLVGLGSARYIRTKPFPILDPPKPTFRPAVVQERGEQLHKIYVPEACDPTEPCDEDAQPAPEGPTPSGVPDDNEIACAANMLKCSGLDGETPGDEDGPLVTLPPGATLFPNVIRPPPNVIHKAGPYSAYYLHQPEFTGHPHSHAARQEPVTRLDDPETVVVDGATFTRQTLVASERDENQETVVIFGDITTTLNPQPTPQLGKRDEDQETVVIFGTITTTLNPQPTPQLGRRDEDQETVVIFGTITTTLNPQPTPQLGRRDEDQETVVIFGTIITTLNPQPTPRPEPDEEQETVIIFGDITTTLNPQPTPQPEPDEVQETVVIFGDITTTLNPQPTPTSHDDLVVEATLVNNDEPRLIIPTSGPQKIVIETAYVTIDEPSLSIQTAAPEQEATPDATKEDFVVPSDMPLASPNPNAGRLDPSRFADPASTTMMRVVRRQLVWDITPDAETDSSAEAS